MERACVCAFLVLCLTQAVLCQAECKLNFTRQPLPELPCRPTESGARILLYCTISDVGATVSWFHTQHEDQAGINGTLIIDDETSPYIFDGSINTYQPSLTFIFNVRFLGFYWCEITDAKYSNLSLRPSTVAHIRNSSEYNSSLSKCPVINHFENMYDQCAIISVSSTSTVLSPTPSIPSFSLSPSLSLSATTSSSLSFTPTESLEPSPTTTADTENNVFLLYALAGLCGLLAVIALVIVIAIFVLCYLTKHQSRRRSYTPKGLAGEDSSGVQGRRNSDDEKPSSQLPQQNINNNTNPSHVPPPPSRIQVQQRGLSFSNPVYDIAKAKSSGSDAFDVFPPRIVPPDKPNTNSLPKYAKLDLSKKKSYSDEEYVPPSSTLPSGSDGVYDQVATSPTDTGSTIGSRLPPPSVEPPELSPSLNLYDDPNELSPILHSPPAAYEEPHLTSPNISSPPPLPPPPVDSALYDDPHEIISPSQPRPDSYMQPLSLINNGGGETENYYSMPVDAMPHEYHELMNTQAPNQTATTTNASTSIETSTAPDNSAAPQESAYDDPWGSMPTGIKRASSHSSKSQCGRPHSINHSVSPNLFDDPQYDTPSPHQTTPIETNSYY